MKTSLSRIVSFAAVLLVAFLAFLVWKHPPSLPATEIAALSSFILLGVVSPCRPFDGLRTATESLPDRLLRRASHMNPWFMAVKKGKYPQGTGVNQTVISIGNSEPTTVEEQWNEVNLSGQNLILNADADSSVCDNTYIDTALGYDETTYGPRRLQLRGPVICETALTFHHNVTQFLNAYERELFKRAQRSWANEMETQYMSFAEKYVDDELVGGDGDPNTAISGTITTLPTSELTQSILEVVAGRLIDQGAMQPDSDGFVSLGDNGPLFTLMIGMQQSSRILVNNADLRADARDARPSDLFLRLGANRVIGNFRHWVVTHPPRFTVVNGALVRIAPMIMTAATHGTKAVPNPNYQAAEYEAAIVIVPDVFEAEIVVPHTGTSWANFKAQNYNGDWQFITGAWRIGLDCDDPKEILGRHYADFFYAPKPIFPEYGKVIIYRRCGLEATLATCAS